LELSPFFRMTLEIEFFPLAISCGNGNFPSICFCLVIVGHWYYRFTELYLSLIYKCTVTCSSEVAKTIVLSHLSQESGTAQPNRGFSQKVSSRIYVSQETIYCTTLWI
jgi:hypothetical protein